MNKGSCLWIAIFAILLKTNVVFPQEPAITLERITPEGGLTYSSVMCITRDSLGYMWLGTNNGLFRYDSKQIKRYFHDNNNPFSLPVNRINQFLTDRQQKLWIATENGLCLYDRDYDCFRTYHFTDAAGNPTGSDIRTLTETPDGEIWIGDEKGIAIIDTVQKKAVYQQFGQINANVRQLYLSKSGILWIGFGDGSIYRFDAGNRSFSFFARNTDDQIMCFYEFEGRLWVGYEKKGMDVFDLAGNLVGHYPGYKAGTPDLSDNRVRCITADKNGNLWIGTYNGIDILKKDSVIHHLDQSNYPEIPDNSIWSLYTDQEQNVWIGTWLGGVCFYHPSNNRFHHFNSALYPISDNLISSFAEDKDGNIWIATERGGINLYNPSQSSFRQIPVKKEEQNVVNIKSIAIDRQQTVWIGTFDAGVWFLPPGTKNFKPFKPLANSRSQIFSISPADSGIWFGSYQNGLYFFNQKTGAIQHYSHDPYNINSLSYHAVRDILTDHRHNLWIATDKGLNLRINGKEEFRHFFVNQSSPWHLWSNLLYDLQEDRNGNIWIGTNGGGVCRYRYDTDRIENFTLQNGLSGNDAYSILEDQEGNLWISTENGLSKYRPDDNTFRSFLNDKGISNNRFNPGAALKASDGTLYFGGSNGFVSFVPALIKKNTTPPKTILTNFYLNNRLSEPGHPDYPFQTHISLARSVELKYYQNSFSFDFITTNYLQPAKNRFRYRLVGFNEEWAETDYVGRATYTNLSPGDYVFEVKGANNDGVWNETPTRLQITIHPPLWTTWWAFAGYAAVLSLVVYYLYTNAASRRKLRQEIILERIRRENEDRLHEMKLRFFTNISHELRTPLTLIIGPLERSLRSGKALLGKELELMGANASRLLRLINQILEFRKIEKANTEFRPAIQDIIPVCNEIFHCFEEMARQKNITFLFQADPAPVVASFDGEKLDMIIFNLLSNAFKFTPSGGSITFAVQKNSSLPVMKGAQTYTIGELSTAEYIGISICDSGPGIRGTDLERIFDRFYQSPQHAESGTGIGLALAAELILLHKGEISVCSVPETGSLFILKIPIVQPASGVAGQTTDLPESTLPLFEREEAETDRSEERWVDQHLYGSVIVVVEDHPELSHYIHQLLKPYFTVICEADGDKGLEAIEKFLPDLVISDVLMPGINGIELCKKTKTGVTTSHIPVILLTALSGTDDQLKGLRVGADDYIPKPFSEEILLAKVNNLLLSRKQLKDSFLADQLAWNQSITGFDLDKKLIQKATHAIEENLQNPNFGVDDLAAELAISRSHLHRKLKSLTDQSATEFIRYVKVQYAIRLMKQKKMPVNEIGFMAGFNSHSYFTKSFKRFTGHSPSDFQRMLNEE